MSTGSFEERLFFAEDMIMHFMKRFRVEWTPGTSGRAFDEHPRRFTEAMGCLAWHFAHSNIEARLNECPFRIQGSSYKPKFSNGYNPEDFLHYCGLAGWTSVYKWRKKEYNFVVSIVFSIVTYLGDITQDGTFTESGGWNTLAKYAHKKLIEINVRSIAERILFAKDMMMYFMKRFGVEWFPGINFGVWHGHRRRFTEEIGQAAWCLGKMHTPSSRFTAHENKVMFSVAYHPRDFLQYCGLMAWISVWKYVNEDAKYADCVILDIISFLGETYQNDSFPALGGWYGLEMYARLFGDFVKNPEVLKIFQNLQTSSTQAMQPAYRALQAKMEEECLGSLLQNW